MCRALPAADATTPAGSSNATPSTSFRGQVWHAFTPRGGAQAASDAVTYQALTVNGAVPPYATLRGQAAEVSIDGITRRPTRKRIRQIEAQSCTCRCRVGPCERSWINSQVRVIGSHTPTSHTPRICESICLVSNCIALPWPRSTIRQHLHHFIMNQPVAGYYLSREEIER